LKVETSKHENGCKAKISKFQVWAVDADSAFIPLHFNFCLTELLRRTLKSGALLWLTSFFPIYYDHGNNSDMRAALFVKKELPRCLVAAIRDVYPNPPGKPYTEFEPASKRTKSSSH